LALLRKHLSQLGHDSTGLARGRNRNGSLQPEARFIQMALLD
jgi:hypothetical protein